MLTSYLLISFFAGGIFVGLQTLVGERVHGFWRAVVLTIPSTMALGLFFIGLTKTPQDVVEAARIAPVALGPDYLFVAVFTLLTSHGIFASILGGLFAWAIGAALILLFPPTTFTVSVVVGLVLIFCSWVIVKKLPAGVELKKYPIRVSQIILRSFIGGGIILLIVFLSNTLGNVWGGLFSAFPAAFTATLVIYYLWQGRDSIQTVAASLFFPGAIGFILYALAAAYAFPIWGIWFGTLAAYLVTFVFFAIFYIIFLLSSSRAGIV